MSTINLQLTTIHMAFRRKVLFPIHHNEMVLFKETITH
jgi:hypothetical protein